MSHGESETRTYEYTSFGMWTCFATTATDK